MLPGFLSSRCATGHRGIGEPPQEPVGDVVVVKVGRFFDVQAGLGGWCGAVDVRRPCANVGGAAVAVVRVAGGDGVDQASRSAGRQFIAGFDALGELGNVVLRTVGSVGIKCPGVGALVEQASAGSAFLGCQWQALVRVVLEVGGAVYAGLGSVISTWRNPRKPPPLKWLFAPK